MLTTFADTAWLLLPLLFGGFVHGAAIKYGWAPWLTRPIDGGRSLRGVRWFGDNKTWRGVVFLGLGTGIFTALEAACFPVLTARVYGVPLGLLGGALVGAAVGALAMLGELPNSFLKRRAGIAPGVGGGGRHAWFFYLYDQVDLLLFVAIAWWAIGAFTWPRFAMALVLVTVIHQALSSIGYRLGMRKTPR